MFVFFIYIERVAIIIIRRVFLKGANYVLSQHTQALAILFVTSIERSFSYSEVTFMAVEKKIENY